MPPQMEFHVSREARERYGLDTTLFALTGNVILADFAASRALVRRMNAEADVARDPDRAVQVGDLHAMGLIDEILHYVVALYRQERDPRAMTDALAAVDERLGRAAVDATLQAFVERYPPTAVYLDGVAADAYLAGTTEGTPNRAVALEELALLRLANANPAFAPFEELFDDAPLVATTGYDALTEALRAHFAARPPFGPTGEPLVDLLRRPALEVPDSLAGQLRWIREHWGAMLGRFMDRLLVSLDVLAEDERARWLRFHGAADAGAAAVSVYDFRGQEAEPERFSMDRDWMPRLVMLAKSAYVWLDQCSKRYGRELRTLDAIPDEELDTLARWGISGLWLIGLWERSQASQRIKQLRGNPDAVASAYSLLDYRIADDLGGEAAYANLRDRAWRRGIRLASDMVPNHMGIDSRWVIEHPDWFLSVPEPPFPSYSFNGPDLSSDDRVGIQIEDHYYEGTDAAVVFKRLDRWSGDARYVYHGNDGTSMPWNDTAQLDYVLADVREAVIQTILEVARHFPVIRFDAAMTLAKRHIQRLWFPEPGSGGAIPSRAEHGMTKAAFDAAMPIEFWREVVDRVAAEVPDTLLLAEAFWLMEGYFVRTLGMHRVYNSAFMNMLRDERNAEYRLVMRNTLEFDPEVMKRYVNFMNNPDERTAIDQFGTGDKYFGVCTLMATLPGLPLFGHGQVEGFAEKYGMEYRRAYMDERPNEELVARHEREIFPLLHRRHLFAEVRDFLLYDVVDADGHVNEDVFAYSNRAGGERSLVVYLNRFAEARGWVRESVAYAARGEGTEKHLVRGTLAGGLGLTDDPSCFCRFRDLRTGLEYLRSSRELHERGMYLELHAYACQVFVELREVRDGEGGPWAQLAAELNGRGVPSLDDALRALLLRPAQAPFRELLDAGRLRGLLAARRDAALGPLEPPDEARLADAERVVAEAVRSIAGRTGGAGDPEAISRTVRARLEVVLGLPGLPGLGHAAKGGARGDANANVRAAAAALREGFPDDLPVWATLLAWSLIHELGRAVADRDAADRLRAWFDEWRLAEVAAGAFRDLGLDEPAVGRAVETLKVLLALSVDEIEAPPETRGGGHAKARTAPARRVARATGARAASGPLAQEPVAARLVGAWLAGADTARYVHVNMYDGVTWFDRDGFERLLRWAFLLDTVRSVAEGAGEPGRWQGRVVAAFELATELQRACHASGYRVDRLRELVGAAAP
jgi:glycosidase